MKIKSENSKSERSSQLNCRFSEKNQGSTCKTEGGVRFQVKALFSLSRVANSSLAFAEIEKSSLNWEFE